MSEIIHIGPHQLLCGDITDGAVGRLMETELADVVYSDPPWGTGAMTMFHTMNGGTPTTSWGDFLDAFVSNCRTYSKETAPIFVEMGMRWEEELVDAMLDYGLCRSGKWVMTYGPKSKPLPVTLNLFSRLVVQPDHQRLAKRITEFMPDPPHGEPVTAHVLRQVVGEYTKVLDPCTGLGMTARWTHKLGGHFRGTELVPKRLDRTVTWLRKNQ